MLDTIRRNVPTEVVLARAKVNLLTPNYRVGGGEPIWAWQQCLCWREARLKKVHLVHVYLHCE